MAYTPALNDIVKIGVFNHAQSQLGLLTHYYQVTGVTGGGVTIADIATDYDLVIESKMVACMSNKAKYLGLKVSCPLVAPLPAPSILNNVQSGTSAADLLPTQVAGIVTWQTLLAGRANRGRSYMPFPSEAFNDADDVPTNSYVTAITDYAQEVLSFGVVTRGTATTTLQLIVFHRALAAGTLADTYRPNQRWATQRRRGAYGKSNLPIIT